ncbi:PepSY-associated TM helix domain-containing protein [Pseudoduganella albidiflava]|uniref:Membrane protein n=1 Tax=Pseudoduganella albidiflava TaxID=321983 RepID=A0A411WZY1_9BURK|nr:PepSY-associated TM helix domain-containing protein [Pseudoduganella albidiflava]QBI02264.1 PepSY domain-containing protein [Pseudoduganella albidiflava]GGY67505.1 membrane protein [Pseudoduganella albidiflava]
METTFRKSMAPLHTWAGVLLGAVLFAVLWTGTLILFRGEIDQWMMPQTRLAAAPAPLSLDRAARLVLPLVPAGATQWRIDLPTARTPVAVFSYRLPDGEEYTRLFDPVRYRLLPQPGTDGASGFLVPLHYSLHLAWADTGKWLVGLAGMAMLVLLVSGVVIHARLVAQLFTFRPRKGLPRSALDLHNLSGVLLLPFHFMLALSGLAIFITVFFPQAHVATYGAKPKAKAAFMAEAYGRHAGRKTGEPGTLASLDAMRREAERLWGGEQPYFVRAWQPGDAAGVIEFRRSYAREVTMNLDQLYFDAATGRVVRRFEAGPVMTAQRVLSGVHFARFEHGTLRALYFAGGLGGCVLVATGFLFWLESRRKGHARHGLGGVRLVEMLAVGGMTGLVLSTLAYLVANRLLPADAGLPEWDRAALERATFYATWSIAFLHAWLRRTAAWREQLLGIAALALVAMLLNWLTTGEHLLQTLANGRHAVAGVDLALLAFGGAAWHAARRIGAGRGSGTDGSKSTGGSDGTAGTNGARDTSRARAGEGTGA